jgi:hypothetical protein
MSEVRMIYIPAAVDPGDYPYEQLLLSMVQIPGTLSDMILSVFTF